MAHSCDETMRAHEWGTGDDALFWGVIEMMFDRGSVACPACSCPVEMTRSVFRSDFRCPHCGVALSASPLYVRFLALLSLLLGIALAWEIGSRGPRNCFLGIPWTVFLLYLPLGFIVLTLLIRIAPFVMRPALVLRRPNHVTTLNLASGPNNGKATADSSAALRNDK
jgi:hypothetical protein